MAWLGQSGFFAVLIFFATVVLVVSASTRAVPGKVLGLMRALLPSWRFFEDLGYAPELYYRIESGPGMFGPWVRCLASPPARSLRSLVFNPEGNLRHACDSLVEALHAELAEDAAADRIERSVSYELTRNLVCREILMARAGGAGTRYQFKIDSVMQGFEEDRLDDVLVSPVHEVREG